MIIPQWLELPMSRTNFHGPKDVWVIEVRLYETVLEYGKVSHVALPGLYIVDSRYLYFAYFELPLFSKLKSGPCFNMEI